MGPTRFRAARPDGGRGNGPGQVDGSGMSILRRLFSYLAPYRQRVAGAYACLLVLTAFNLVIPHIVQIVIDQGIGRHQYGLLWRLALLIVAIFVVKGAFAFGQGFLSEYSAQHVAYDLRNELFDQFQRLSFSYHDRTRPAS